MNKDLHPSNIAATDYIEAWNAVQNSIEHGNIFNLSNEKGFSIFSDFKVKKPNNIIIGMYPINGRIIIFSITVFDEIDYKTSSSEVGYVDTSGVYKEVVNDINPDYYQNGFKPSQSNIDSYSGFSFLNFNINYKIDCEGRINYNNQLIIYWVDGINRPRYIEIDKDYGFNQNLFENINNQSLIIDNPLKTQVSYSRTIESGGRLAPGIYQFVIRYVNAQFGTTTFGYICNPIPVIDENRNNNRNEFDGVGYNYPNSINKSIELLINNIDTSYDYFELIVVYYIGSSNAFKANIHKRFNIDGSIQKIIFNGEIEDEILIDEVTQVGVDYSSAKHITQKDGRLFLSNLKTKSKEETSLQPIANKLIIEYNIKEIEVNVQSYGPPARITQPGDEWFYNSEPEFFDYKEEKNTFDLKGYMRDEVYSFGIVGIDKNNNESFVYHIPCNLYQTINNLNIYESSNNYPVNSEVKDENGNSLAEKPIRLHKFPSLSKEPHILNNGSITKIRILGFKIPNIQSVLDEYPELRDYYKELIIVRVKRDKLNNRSIYSQGLTHRVLLQDGRRDSKIFIKGQSLVSNSSVFINEIDSSLSLNVNKTFARVDPLNNKTIFLRRDGSSLLFTIGNFQERLTPFCAFYSPEVIFGTFIDYNTDYILSEEIDLSGEAGFVEVDGLSILGEENNRITDTKAGYSAIFFNYSGTRISLNEKKEILQMFPVNYNQPFKITETTFQNLIDLDQDIYVNINNNLYAIGSGSEPYLLFKLNSDFNPIDFSQIFIVDNSEHSRFFNPSDPLNNTNWIENISTNNSFSNGYLSRKLNNLKRDNSKYAQYGFVEDNEYIQIDILSIENKKIIEPKNGEYFNGDIFISKFHYNSSTSIEQTGLYFKNAITGPTNGLSNRHVVDVGDSLNLNKNGYMCRGAHYYWVESEINTNYRHRPVDYVDPLDPGTWVDGPSYYPKNRTTQNGVSSIFKPDAEFGHSNGYNILYSKENSIKKYFIQPFNFEQVNEFPTRTIYSEQTLEGETQDKNRIFLPNNYQDLPKNKGEITGQFIHLNTLYLHTERSIFKTFVNQANIISGSQQEITLGNGGVFNNPPQEIYPLQSGHAGLVHKDTGVHTPFGYFFMDYHNKKVFLFGENLEEISQTGMFDWFKSNIKEIQNNIANPDGSGAIAFYDPDNRRYVLSVKFNDKEYKTLSFSLLSKKWVSFHSYYPTVVIASDQEVYSSSDKINGIYLHNSGDYGIYYDQLLINLFVIEFCINEGKLISKVYDSLQVVCESLSENDKLDMLDFFNSIKCYTNNQETNLTELKVLDNNDYTQDEFEFNVRKVNNQFQLKIPLEKESEARLRSKYMIVKFEYKNSKNLYFTLMEIISKIRLSTR